MAEQLIPLNTLLARCQEDTRKYCGVAAANLLGRWSNYTTPEQWITFIVELIWSDGNGPINGLKIHRNSGISLESIVIYHRPDLFDEGTINQAKRNLNLL